MGVAGTFRPSLVLLPEWTSGVALQNNIVVLPCQLNETLLSAALAAPPAPPGPPGHTFMPGGVAVAEEIWLHYAMLIDKAQQNHLSSRILS